MRFTNLLVAMLITVVLVARLEAQSTRQDMPTPTVALGSLTVRGYKVYYGDGTVQRVGSGNFLAQWRKLPLTGVQVVVVYFNQTYNSWHETAAVHAAEVKCDADVVYPTRDRTRIGHCVVIPYMYLFHGARGNGEFYWYDGTSFGAGAQTTDIPPKLVGTDAVKTGTLLLFTDFRKILQTAQGDETP